MSESVSAPLRIDIYSDTVCPWCYLGKRRFELALAARPHYEPRITWRPFELNPDMRVEGVTRSAFFAAKGGAAKSASTEDSLTSLGVSLGLQFRFDRIARMPNTRRSHLLIAHAARYGLQGPVKDRIMQAYFQEGADIGDIDELVRLGMERGLAEREARVALVLRAGQDGVVAAERHAALLGITGVPTFVFDGKYTLSGSLEPAAMTRIFDQVVELARAREAAP